MANLQLKFGSASAYRNKERHKAKKEDGAQKKEEGRISPEDLSSESSDTGAEGTEGGGAGSGEKAGVYHAWCEKKAFLSQGTFR